MKILKEHGIAVYVIRTRKLLVKLVRLDLVSTTTENNLLSLLKKTSLIFLKLLKQKVNLEISLQTVKIFFSKQLNIDVKM